MPKRTKKKTRINMECPLLGNPKELSVIVLPTVEDVMKYYLWVRDKADREGTSGKPKSVSEISASVARKIESIWSTASIPCISHQRIVSMIRSYHSKLSNLLKSMKKTTDAAVQARKSFQEHCKSVLFDVTACKCSSFDKCSCDPQRKVPAMERKFLTDQRYSRRMFIGGVDVKTTRKVQRTAERMERREKSKKRKMDREQKETEACRSGEVQDCGNDELEDDEEEFEEYELPYQRKRGVTTKAPANRLSLPNFSLACDRTGVSDRSASQLANAMLTDVGIISEADSSKAIDKSKVRRERKKTREQLKSTQAEEKLTLKGIYFDGRRDNTMVREKKGGVFHQMVAREEHVSVVHEPGAIYVGHFSPSSGSSSSLASGLTELLEKENLLWEQVRAIGCDGTPVNTGHLGGVIRLLELKLKRPLQWAVCLLHGNELPLRRLMQYLDGQTTGPCTFSGPIGVQLQNCDTLPIVNFERIEIVLPTVDPAQLSSDQQYLFEICKAIASGQCTSALQHKNPGTLSHSRWITAANRILRLYVGTEQPPDNLKILVTFIMKVYAPSWFDIKCKPLFEEGARHLWKMFARSRYLSEGLKKVVDPVIKRNGFFGHPENILLCMIKDDRKHIKELSLRRILKAREEEVSGEIRIFKIPPLNEDASDYTELLNWIEIRVTEPPLTKHIPTLDIQRMIKGEIPLEVEVIKIPCHTQAVERTVKLVTEASAAVCGYANRDGFIRSRLESRRRLPKVESKKDFVKSITLK